LSFIMSISISRLRCWVGLLVGLGAIGISARAADWSQFKAGAERSAFRVDYRPVAQFTKNFSVQDGARRPVAYPLVKTNGISLLVRYTGYLENQDVAKLDRDAQLAYWLNVRNLLVVQAVADLERGSDFATARGTGIAPGPVWTQPRFTIGDVTLSIDDIERRILVAGWDDPRILYGLYQGTESGPAFPAAAFEGDTVYAQLDAAAQQFTNSDAGVRVSWSKARLSPVYDWYKREFFGDDDARLRAHLAAYLEEGLAKKFGKAKKLTMQDFASKIESFQPRRIGSVDEALEESPRQESGGPDEFVGRGS
jgi:hypothetical protein